MKSMLHEASSIIKAIEKAWIECGKPVEFTVKVLEKGEKNFIGLTKRPAIVSITYNPDLNFDKSRNSNFNQNRPPRRSQQVPYTPNAMEQQPQRVVFKDDLRRQTQPQISAQKNVSEKIVPRRDPILDREVAAEKDIVVWNDEMADFCTINLKEILSLLRIDSSFTTKINNRNLIVTFDKNITSLITEDIKSFFASVAHIQMQLLKRKYKKKFKGFQIIVNTAAYNDQSNSTKFN